MKKDKLTNEGLKQRNLEEVEWDHMPAEVAVELLCDPKARLTNRMRKNCLEARQRRFKSTIQPKALPDKLAARLLDASISQVAKWLKRGTWKRKGIQRRYESLLRLPENPVRDRLIAGVSLAAGLMDEFLGGLEDWTRRVNSLTRGEVPARSKFTREGEKLGLVCLATGHRFVWVPPVPATATEPARPGKWVCF